MVPKLFILLLLPFCISAHPSIAIKFDSKGNLFYSDLYNVYKIDPAGNKSVAVANVHTHEISIDKLDNIYGEHTWYEGEASDKWGHFVWKLSSKGVLSKVKDSTEGFLTDYSFLRDSADNLYIVERPSKNNKEAIFKKRDAHGNISLLAKKQSENVSWQFVDAGGTIYFYDEDDLFALHPNGTFKLIAENIGTKDGTFNLERDRHAMMGIWMDDKTNLYVADFTGQQVKQINRKGEVRIIYKTDELWSPTGGTFDSQGNLWLLEGGPMGESRITKVKKSGFLNKLATSIAKPSTTGFSYTILFALIPILLLAIWLILRKKAVAHDSSIH